ncbi:urease accessory protein UreE [Gordonia rubripertincta]|uniref:Urease accessory protein UreE n=1 Tax=Gordonia rubripertincta TaxID=36822 RepID=A0AAW4G875_GORRU|nr:urease accessory protein UreE [Gordonia rubripertincta]MBM7279282.1 urease accessory protein UreE [Gordonia rubripertincta]
MSGGCTSTAAVPRLLDTVIGHESDAELADILHELRHHRAVDHVHLEPADLDRRRLRVTSADGVDYALALPRGTTLRDGSVLSLDTDGAVVVRAGAPIRLRMRAHTIPAAIRVGFLAGHLHWKCDQDGDTLDVLVDGVTGDYLARVRTLIESGELEVTVPEAT